jgi:hypothetical protein
MVLGFARTANAEIIVNADTNFTRRQKPDYPSIPLFAAGVFISRMLYWPVKPPGYHHRQFNRSLNCLMKISPINIRHDRHSPV